MHDHAQTLAEWLEEQLRAYSMPVVDVVVTPQCPGVSEAVLFFQSPDQTHHSQAVTRKLQIAIAKAPHNVAPALIRGRTSAHQGTS